MANDKYRVLTGLFKRLIDWGDGHHGEHVGVTPVSADGTVLANLPVMPATAVLTEHTFTIASGQSVSNEIDLGGQAICKIYSPAALEAGTTQLGILEGRVTTGEAQVLDMYGAAVKVAVTAGQPTVVDMTRLHAMRFVKLQTQDSTGAGKPQTADRAFIVVTRPI